MCECEQFQRGNLPLVGKCLLRISQFFKKGSTFPLLIHSLPASVFTGSSLFPHRRKLVINVRQPCCMMFTCFLSPFLSSLLSLSLSFPSLLLLDSNLYSRAKKVRHNSSRVLRLAPLRFTVHIHIHTHCALKEEEGEKSFPSSSNTRNSTTGISCLFYCPSLCPSLRQRRRRRRRQPLADTIHFPEGKTAIPGAHSFRKTLRKLKNVE